MTAGSAYGALPGNGARGGRPWSKSPAGCLAVLWPCAAGVQGTGSLIAVGLIYREAGRGRGGIEKPIGCDVRAFDRRVCNIQRVLDASAKVVSIVIAKLLLVVVIVVRYWEDCTSGWT